MELCEFCGEELINPTDKKRYCSKRDNRKCYSQRTAAQSKKNQLKRAKKRNNRCPICKGLIIRPGSTTCSPSCSAKLKKKKSLEAYRKKEARALQNKLNKTIYEWMYKMPHDPCVTPADMCPLI